jgi:hypothetical protein
MKAAMWIENVPNSSSWKGLSADICLDNLRFQILSGNMAETT